jgi:hypothetical protein
MHITDRDSDDERSGDAVPASPQSLQEIGITELLEQDTRPTFVLDLKAPETSLQGRMTVVFCNTSLRFFDDLRKVVSAETFFPPPLSLTSSNQQESIIAAELEFKEWATSSSGFNSSTDGYLPRFTFHGMFWTCTTLRDRWRVVSASQVPNQLRRSHETLSRSSRSTSRSTSTPKSSVSEGSDSECAP